MLGDRIRTLRLSRDWAQVHLADACRTTKKTIESWENGTREPKIADLIRLADVFNCTLDYLVGREAELS